MLASLLHADGETIAFLECDEQGVITSITDFWPEPYDPPPGRVSASINR